MWTRMTTVVSLMLFGVAISLSGCNGPTASGTDPTPDPTADEFECGGPDYPCAFGDVAPEVAAAGAALLDDVAERMLAGMSSRDVSDWLLQQPGVVESQWGTTSVRFRLAGGRPLVYAFVPVASEPLDGAALRGRPASTHIAAPPQHHSTPRVSGAFVGNPAGTDRTGSGDLSQRDPRQALVISAFYFEIEYVATAFGRDPDDFDGGATIAEIIGTTPGYFDPATNEPYVTHVVNREPMEHQNRDVLDAFYRLDEYDAMYISAHGTTECRDGECHSAIFTGYQVEDCALYGEAISDAHFMCGRIDYQAASGDTTGVRSYFSIAITSDFLLEHYPAGIRNAVVWFQTCELLYSGEDDTVTPERHHFYEFLKRGEYSLFFAWDNVVLSERAVATATMFFREYTRMGVTSARAIDLLRLNDRLSVTYDSRLRGRSVTANLHRFGRYVPTQRAADVEVRRQSGTAVSDLRIREVARILDADAEPLLDGASITPFLSSNGGDGGSDSLDLHVQVDGVLPDQASEFVIRFELDGRPIGQPVPLSDANPVPFDEPYSYLARVDGVAAGVEFTSNEPYALKLIVDLPEGGDSRYDVDVVAPLCFADATIAGEYQARVAGPAQVSYALGAGRVFLRFTEWQHLRYLDGDAATGGFDVGAQLSGVSGVPAPGTYDLEEVEILFAPQFFTEGIAWSARQTARDDCLSAPCPGCEPVPCGAATLTVTSASERHLSGSISGVLLGMDPYEEGPPPYWEVTYEVAFHAVTGLAPSVDPTSDYATCLAAGP